MSPVMLDPNSVIEIWCASDMHIPQEKRPVFLVRALNNRLFYEVSALVTKVQESSDGPDGTAKLAIELMPKLEAMFQRCLVDWRNMNNLDGSEIPFDVDKVGDILTPSETYELLMKAMTGADMGHAEKKALESLSRSDSDNYAKSADPPTHAEEAPPSENQPSSTAPDAAE